MLFWNGESILLLPPFRVFLLLAEHQAHTHGPGSLHPMDLYIQQHRAAMPLLWMTTPVVCRGSADLGMYMHFTPPSKVRLLFNNPCLVRRDR